MCSAGFSTGSLYVQGSTMVNENTLRIIRALLFGLGGYFSAKFGTVYRTSEELLLAEKSCVSGVAESCLKQADIEVLIAIWQPNSIGYLYVSLVSFLGAIFLNDICTFVVSTYNNLKQRKTTR